MPEIFNAPLPPSNLRGGVGYHRRSRCLEGEQEQMLRGGVEQMSAVTPADAGGMHAI